MTYANSAIWTVDDLTGNLELGCDHYTDGENVYAGRNVEGAAVADGVAGQRRVTQLSDGWPRSYHAQRTRRERLYSKRIGIAGRGRRGDGNAAGREGSRYRSGRRVDDECGWSEDGMER